MKSELDYLLSPRAIRERSLKLFQAAESGRTHFAYHPEKLEPVVDFVIEVIDTAHLDRVLKAIERVDGVITARRIRAWQER